MAISKAAKVATAGVVYLKMDNPSYQSYLRMIVGHNKTVTQRKALALRGKSAFDAEYSSQLQKQYGHDEGIIRAHLQEINSKANAAAWDNFARRCAQKEKGRELPAVIDSEIDSLKLPSVCRAHGHHGPDAFNRQTYQDFASKAEKDNSSMKFTKAVMDNCFRTAISRLTKRAEAPGGIDKVLKRCLGKESDDYWKNR